MNWPSLGTCYPGHQIIISDQDKCLDTDLVRLPGAGHSTLPPWLLLPLLGRGGRLVPVTRARLAATSAVQHPDLHLDVTVTPVTMVMVIMVVMVVMVMAASLIMLVVMMVMDLRSGLLPHWSHVSSATLASDNHPRPRVNPLHPENKSLLKQLLRI